MNDNNKYEVGFTPDDNNDIRLPGSVQPEPQRGDSAYHHLEMAKVGSPLATADTAGVVGQPTWDGGYGMEGHLAPSLNSNVDVHNSDTSLMAPVGDSETNLSRKYKYPNVKQSIDPLDNPKVTFNDHT